MDDLFYFQYSKYSLIATTREKTAAHHGICMP